MRLKSLINSVVCIICFIIIACFLSHIFTNNEFDDKYRAERLYKEPENTIDVIAVGSSPVLYDWNYLCIWKKYHITSMPVAFMHLGLFALKYIINESLKRQTPKLLVVSLDVESINVYSNAAARSFAHRHILYLKPSKNKFHIIQELNKYSAKYSDKKLSLLEKAEFYFPVIRFHDNWKKRKKYPQRPKLNIKYAFIREGYFSPHYCENNPDINRFETSIIGQFNDEEIFLIRDLFSYLKTLNIPVLIVSMPKYLNYISYQNLNINKLSQLDELTEEYNLKYINFNSDEYYPNINLTSDDFEDVDHLNFKGSIKFMNYFMPILIKEYNLSSEYPKDVEISWNASFIMFARKIKNLYNVNAFDI